jgi:hypothetical protein
VVRKVFAKFNALFLFTRIKIAKLSTNKLVCDEHLCQSLLVIHHGSCDGVSRLKYIVNYTVKTDRLK